MATLTKPSRNPTRNPFRSNVSTPTATGTSSVGSQPIRLDPPSPPIPEDTPPLVAPAVSVTPAASREPSRFQDSSNDFLEEPPPYTPNPSYVIGETTVEQGPARSFQPPPPAPRPGSTPSPNGWARAQSHVIPQDTGTSGFSSRPSGARGGSLFQQLANSLTNAVNNLNIPPPGSGGLSTHPTGQSASGWSAYPGGQQQQQAPSRQPSFAPPPGPPPANGLAPPRHPRSTSSASTSAGHSRSNPSPNPPNPPMRRHSSEFARDFYAAGAGNEFGVGQEGTHAPPSGPPPTSTPARNNTTRSAPDNGRPTERPVAGRPLLKDGKVLVYPKGYECDKCHNVGYKNGDPSHPCNRCWNKYSKSFSGPLVYSFSPSSTSTGMNLQRPLPHQAPPAPPSPQQQQQQQLRASFPPHGGYFPSQDRGFSSPSRGYPTPVSHPPQGSVVYTAGDPRIGGRLCWRCNGKGNVSFLLLDRMTCEVCGGIGRTFNH